MLTAGLLAVASFLVMSSQPRAAQEKAPSAHQMELLKERLGVLQQVHEVASALFSHARCSFEEVLAARRQLLQAQLEAATTDKERIEILEKMVEEATKTEEVAKRLKESAQASELPVLQAKADRLTAEIQLDRGRQGEFPRF
jgi:hypothetical protein